MLNVLKWMASEGVSTLVGPQWSLGEWMFVIWATLLTVVVCLMFVWWMAVQLFDPEDFEDVPVGGSTVDAVAGAADFLARRD